MSASAHDMLGDLVSRMFAEHCTDDAVRRAETGAWPDALWRLVEDAGLPLALIEAGEHSLGVAAADGFGVVRRTGEYAVPLPLAETMLANWLLARCGLAPRAGPLVIASDSSLRAVDGGSRLVGTAESVPWGRHAGVVAVFAHEDALNVARLDREGIAVREGASIAREPRDHLAFDAALGGVAIARLPAGIDRTTLRAAAAALRCSQIAGALQSTAAMTIDYASQRVQFGRPLAKFQAVQQSVALLAGHAAAAGAAADMAADAFADGIRLAPIAAAKTFAGEAAGAGAAIAHQMHGAIGFSREYALQLRTRRLWSWRDEHGNEAEWSAWLGTMLCTRGADALWAAITEI